MRSESPKTHLPARLEPKAARAVGRGDAAPGRAQSGTVLTMRGDLTGAKAHPYEHQEGRPAPSCPAGTAQRRGRAASLPALRHILRGHR